VPRRHTLRGIGADCVRALGLPTDSKRLLDWLSVTGRDEWGAIKRTLGTGNGKPAAPPNLTAAACSLDEFAREKRREGCPVCALPASVRAILATAGDKGHKVALQVEWLKVKCGVQDIGVAELGAHRNGRHEQ
jgi:hypothetical protein